MIVERPRIEQIRLACELLCVSHKKDMPKYINSLVKALGDLTSEQKMSPPRIEALCVALLNSSDATKADFEIVNDKVYIATPMYIDPVELAKRMIW